MNWLLISTATRTPDTLSSNVGDEFARVGIQQVIREVDASATFDVLDKEDPAQWNPRPFDKAVVCGMPLFWSLATFGYPGSQNCQEVWWWPRLFRGWPSGCREKLLVWGVGHVFVDRIRSLHDYVASIEEVLNKAWAVVVREPILDHPNIVESVCPSAFCLMDRKLTRELPVCNLMPTGGHFGYLTPDAEVWQDRLRPISDLLRELGSTCLTHSNEEAEFAYSLGWPADRVKLPVTVGGYFDWYSRASCYIGNRLHGAAICAGAGLPTWGISHDSRVGMVKRLGGKATRIADATPEAIRAWHASLPASGRIPTPFDVQEEYGKMVRLVRRFAAAKPLPPWTQ